MILSLFVYLFLTTAGAAPNDCELYLDRPVTFDEFYPPAGEGVGFAGRFLCATQEYMFALGELRSGLDCRVPRDPSEMLAFEIGQDTRLADELERALDAQVPAVRNILVSIHGLNGTLDVGADVYTQQDVPLHILPGEWQRELLERLKSDPPPFTTPAMIDRFITLSAKTTFRLRPKETGPARDAFDPVSRLTQLDPKSGIGWLLEGLVQHYLGDQRRIDPVELRRVYNQHVTFWIADPLGEKRILQ